MSTSHPRPRRAWAQQILTLLVATCLTLLAVSAGAVARTTQPTATISSATLRSAIAVRTADKRALAHDSRRLQVCLHTRHKRCTSEQLALKRSHIALSAAKQRVLALTAHIARRRHAPAATRTSDTVGEANSGSSSNSSAGTVDGLGSSTDGSSSNIGDGATENPIGSKKAIGSTGLGGNKQFEGPEATSAVFQPGLNSGSDPTYDIPGAAQLGAKLVRIAFDIDETPQQMETVISEYAAKGIQVEPMASFYGKLPTPAEAQNLASWANAFGPGGTFWTHRSGTLEPIQSIEFGNETSYSYQYSNDTVAGYASRAQTYALRFAEAVSAIRSTNPSVGLLAQGDAGNANSAWVENMFKAVPNLGGLVAGWTIHPYGPEWRDRLETLIQQTAAQGAPSTIPIDVTEWGLSSDNGHCLTENYGWNACMSYQEAGEALSETVSEMRQMLGSRLDMFMLYQVRDQEATGASNQRESYFGALQHELQPKGAYTTAVKSLLSA
ncbi:MAG: hypothetical protein WBV77_03640 [Solirubrobacteraceae bacterium]|jgi:hypothetical protein